MEFYGVDCYWSLLCNGWYLSGSNRPIKRPGHKFSLAPSPRPPRSHGRSWWPVKGPLLCHLSLHLPCDNYAPTSLSFQHCYLMSSSIGRYVATVMMMVMGMTVMTVMAMSTTVMSCWQWWQSWWWVVDSGVPLCCQRVWHPRCTRLGRKGTEVG